MSLNVEGIMDRGLCLKKSLRRLPILEALHLSLAPSDRKMRVLGAVVVA